MERRSLLGGLAALPASFWAKDKARPADRFDEVAEAALTAMRAKANSLGVGGAAVVIFCPGDSVTGWSSKMTVVGRYKDEAKDTSPGSNLIAIAYAKAAEMADTHKDSGSHVRPVMTGEVGWAGGAIVQCETGYLIAAFSGGKDADDLAVSHAGLAVLQQISAR